MAACGECSSQNTLDLTAIATGREETPASNDDDGRKGAALNKHKAMMGLDEDTLYRGWRAK